MSLPEISGYYFSAVEFERMGEAGVFRKDARLELIEGEIIELSPRGSRHAARVKFPDRFAKLKRQGKFKGKVKSGELRRLRTWPTASGA